MRNVIYKIAACSALVALVLSGCKESFLEEDPNGYISSDQIKENAVWNPNIMLGQALGTYSTTFALADRRYDESRRFRTKIH